MKATDKQSAHFIVQDSGIGANKTLYAEARSNSPGYRMYDDAVQSNVLVKNASGDILVGEVGDRSEYIIARHMCLIRTTIQKFLNTFLSYVISWIVIKSA